MRETDRKLDWIRLVIAIVLGAFATLAIVFARFAWFFYPHHQTGRCLAIAGLWLCFSILFWLKSPKPGDGP